MGKGGPAETGILGATRDSVDSRLDASTGYAVNFPRFSFDRANARLVAPDGKYMPLFIEEYLANFELAGSTGQSQMVRTFYSRNFQLPAYVIRGQCPNQAYYNRLGEFVHYFQRKAVTTGQPGKLEVPTGGMNVPNLRGLNAGFLAEGYVLNIERGGEFGEFAPEYEFNFTVSNMLEGLYQEKPVVIRQLKSWADILKTISANGGPTFVIDPDLPDEAAQVLVHIGHTLGSL